MIHPSAEVSPKARVGKGTQVWNEVQIREGAAVGENCIIAKGVYIDRDVVIGSNVKIENRASVYRGVTLEDGVFVGPHVSFTNDRFPRSVTPEGRLRTDADWEPERTLVRQGASLGAGTVVVPGRVIGRWAMVGAGSLVTRDVPDHALVLGSPARQVGYVCDCGKRLEPARPAGGAVDEAEAWRCPECGRSFELPPLAAKGEG
jgi:UDP-2-acetamido-3-amino-2,3-dideoxy-glucuronate N-acetyltransferase